MQNEIERSITIHATRDRVWALVSEPGWWINAGEIVDHVIESDGATHRVTDPTHGTFRVETVESLPQERVCYRWLSGPDSNEPALQTLVEFSLVGDNPVELTVRESGFLTGDVPEEQRRRDYDANASGWEIELEAARQHVLRS